MAEVNPNASDPAFPDRSKALADQEAFMAEDFEFLQKRTRWWLETVLNEPLDEAKPTAEILDNGQVLLRLGQGVDKILADPSRDYKDIFQSVTGTTMKAKYLAYEHVDKFLKVCRNLGMDDTVLVTSADVVEHKNPRRVSLLLRDLSKRARAKGSNASPPHVGATSQHGTQEDAHSTRDGGKQEHELHLACMWACGGKVDEEGPLPAPVRLGPIFLAPHTPPPACPTWPAPAASC
eukprot:jgi/Mesvir1/10868/Mv14209-RA.1